MLPASGIGHGTVVQCCPALITAIIADPERTGVSSLVLFSTTDAMSCLDTQVPEYIYYYTPHNSKGLYLHKMQNISDIMPVESWTTLSFCLFLGVTFQTGSGLGSGSNGS